MRTVDRNRAIIFVSIVGFFFLVQSIPALAQSLTTTIVGVVLDGTTGTPIENASISIAGIETTRAVTEADGNFIAVNIPVAQPYRLVTITVTASGYGSWTMRDTPLYPNVTMALTVYLSLQDQLIVVGPPRAVTGALQSKTDFNKNAPRMVSYFSNDTIPSTVRVAITGYVNCSDWLDANKPVIRVDTVDFKEYTKNVLPHEWIPSWGNDAPDSLRAGAMAVKMFAWRLINVGWRSQQGADVVDNTCDQYYVPGSHYSTTDAAVDLTWVFRMRRSSVVIEIHYASTAQYCQSLPPCMPQWGSYDDALNGMDWRAILHKYYDPVQIDAAYQFHFPMVVR